MPLYEYKCHLCGETFEVLQRFSDRPLEHHAACGGVVERLISPSAFQFKGTGWYVTDYAKGRDRGGRNGKDGSSSKDDSSSKPEKALPAKPAESKPAASGDSASKS